MQKTTKTTCIRIGLALNLIFRTGLKPTIDEYLQSSYRRGRVQVGLGLALRCMVFEQASGDGLERLSHA